MPTRTHSGLSDRDYARLAELRHALRSFLHWSGDEARRAGVTPAQHQLLLTIRAASHPDGPTVGEVAQALLIRPHSAVELADRAQEAGLIERRRDADQHSQVRLSLTERGGRRLEELSETHVRELQQLAPAVRALWDLGGIPEPAPGTSGTAAD
ncbi:MAG TPA: MarR family winged helix-turn-helix transcriptional regulator [Solirubrobacteraceae bacterium]|nr:MarR family winged helix-turn-helix transcriptional regulator [Solirubrobacteraceae bacterium]